MAGNFIIWKQTQVLNDIYSKGGTNKWVHIHKYKIFYNAMLRYKNFIPGKCCDFILIFY